MSTTTPHRVPMTTSYTPSQTPSRRALGDLTTKAINTPSSQSAGFGSSQVAQAQSPLKQVAIQGPTAFGDKENLAHACSKGRKRGIDEVDGTETADHLKILARRRGDSLMGPAPRLTTDAIHLHTENNPAGLANPGSPTERNTPTPDPEMMQDSQKSNQSFSDLLDYGMCASQKSEHGIPLESAPKPAPAPASKPTAIEARKARAEQLRTRLKFGLYKVATNQVGRRDADIISTFESHISYSPHVSSSTTAKPPHTDPHRVPNITISSPRRDPGVLLIKANLDPFHPIAKLTPAPVLFPPPRDNSAPAISTPYDPSSSPPGIHSISPQQLTSPGTTTQRQHQQHHASHPAHHTDSDTRSRHASAHQRLQRLRHQQYLASDVAAGSGNAVKDNAAEGLMELMSSVR